MKKLITEDLKVTELDYDEMLNIDGGFFILYHFLIAYPIWFMTGLSIGAY